MRGRARAAALRAGCRRGSRPSSPARLRQRSTARGVNQSSRGPSDAEDGLDRHSDPGDSPRSGRLVESRRRSGARRPPEAATARDLSRGRLIGCREPARHRFRRARDVGAHAAQAATNLETPRRCGPRRWGRPFAPVTAMSGGDSKRSTGPSSVASSAAAPAGSRRGGCRARARGVRGAGRGTPRCASPVGRGPAPS